MTWVGDPSTDGTRTRACWVYALLRIPPVELYLDTDSQRDSCNGSPESIQR